MRMGFGFSLVVIMAPLMASAQILPFNKLHLSDTPLLTMNITEAEFNVAIDEVVDAYRPVIERYATSFEAVKLWDDSEVNGYAEQRGSSWKVIIHGGLARRPEISIDGLQLVVCHEVGHHLGGFPFSYPTIPSSDWISAEGQADYFATQECAKRIWAHDHAVNAEAEKTVSPAAKATCDLHEMTLRGRHLCYRIANASLGPANISAETAREAKRLSFQKTDRRRVMETYGGHPDAQCRLDTYMQGALCPVDFDLNRIPGRGHPTGQDSVDAESEAAELSCMRRSGHTYGMRPACWFRERF